MFLPVRYFFPAVFDTDRPAAERVENSSAQVSDQVVQAPLSSRYGAPAEQGLGTSSLQAGNHSGGSRTERTQQQLELLLL